MAHRIASRAWVFVAVLAALVAVAPRARADAKSEATAKGLDTKAMQEDYLATDFDKALEKLNKAANACGADKCSAQLRAQIKRDIGVVQVAGKQNRDAGVAAFVDALKADAAITLDPDTKTKDIEAAWSEAKRQGAASPSPVPGAAPSGDFNVTVPTEQQVRTPVPIYAEYGGSEELAKVVAKYKGFGMKEWKSLELKQLDKGWGAEIPCADVQQGEVHVYVQGFNSSNDPVATSGDRNNPFKTIVKREALAGDAPHLPGKDPPHQCADTGDCPPDFPGCKQPAADASPSTEEPEPTGKDEGETCEDDNECKSGTCKDEKCTAPAEHGTKRPKFWIGFEGQFDFMSLPTANDVCLLNTSTGQPANSAGYYCQNADGSDYPARSAQDPTGKQNSEIVKGVSDRVAGGFAPATLRLKLSFDYAVTTNIMIGGRVGIVIGNYTGTAASNDGKTFPLIDVEARGTYVFGKDPIGKAGLAPYVMVAGGVAPWASNVSVTVVQTGTLGTRTENAWATSGPGFVSAGGGIRYSFTAHFAGYIGPRVNFAFGGSEGSAISLSPELGLQGGF